jgi:hypothetical protein
MKTLLTRPWLISGMLLKFFRQFPMGIFLIAFNQYGSPLTTACPPSKNAVDKASAHFKDGSGSSNDFQ